MIRTIAAAVATALTLAAPVSAESPRLGWYVNAGPAYVGFSESASIAAGGVPILGANATLENNGTLALALGYRFSNPFSVVAIAGVPPTTTIKGTGPLEGITVGDVTYGPLIVAANYHFPTRGKFQPFVGLGANYTIVFDTKDGGISNLKADSAFGFVIRAGFDYMFTERNGFFFSANKVFVDTKARGNATALGGAPIKANIDLDPLILHAGWVHRF